MDSVDTLQSKVHGLLAEAFALLKGDGNLPTRESSLTKTKLEEAIMWNNKDRAMRGELAKSETFVG